MKLTYPYEIQIDTPEEAAAYIRINAIVVHVILQTGNALDM